MKKRNLLLAFAFILPFTLASCNTGKFEYKKIESYKDSIKTYKNKTDVETFNQLDDKLIAHKESHDEADYVQNSYYYSKTISNDNFTNSNGTSIKTSHFIKKVDYDNHLYQDSRVSDENLTLNTNNSETTSNEHKIENYGYQEIGDYLVIVEKENKIYRDLPKGWYDIEKNTYPQIDLATKVFTSNETLYIDDNVYTAISNEVNEDSEVRNFRQIVLKDN